MPRVLITSFTYPPNKDGVAEAARSMAEGLASTGWDVTVATQNHPARQTSRVNGVAVVGFDLATSTFRSEQSFAEAERYKHFLKSLSPDFLINHCWDPWCTRLALPLFPNLRGKKIQVSHGYTQHIWHFHPRFPFFGSGQWAKGLFWTAGRLPAMVRAYDAIVILSDVIGMGRFFDHTVARWMKHRCIRIIPNSTNPDQFPSDRGTFRRQHSIGDRLMVLCVANYSHRKNQELAIRAFRKARLRDSILVLVGSEFNEYSEHVKRIDAALASEDCEVVFLDNLSRQETLEAFVASDIFLLTAKAETQPFVLIEAMAAGVPWISTPTGCARVMEGGVVAKGGDLASTISRLAQDPNLRRKLGSDGKEAIRSKYCANKTMDAFEALLGSLGKGGPSAKIGLY
jgi:glycosyltransferase involved in cell wall biosynthesis